MTEARTPHGLVTLDQPRSAAAEAYRTLRANIRFSSIDRSAKTILVTSAGPQEGKTTTLANLAVIAAQAGNRVLAIDCDLRRPALHAVFDIVSSSGFTDLLLNENGTEIKAVNGPIAGLSLVPSGPLPPNPAELLSMERVDRLLEIAAKDYDLVLLDSPPAGAVADSSILAPRVDGVILVIDATRTHREQARRAKEQLERVNARLLGVVVNRAQVDSSSMYYQ